MRDPLTLQFRAIVSFPLEGVLHHAAGSWQSSKKAAQRDAAERVLAAVPDQAGVTDQQTGSCTPPELCKSTAQETLEAFCVMLVDGRGCPPRPQWKCERTAAGWQAVVDLELLGVPYTFPGAEDCSDAFSAREDTARRVLWYTKCTGYEDTFEAVGDDTTEGQDSLPPREMWQRESNGAASNEYLQRAAEQKTVLMRAQNRLQKFYAKQLSSGARAWDWSYEFSSNTDGAAVPLCRARVQIPVAQREFAGHWRRGQKAAQLDACNHVTEFLNMLEKQIG